MNIFMIKSIQELKKNRKIKDARKEIKRYLGNSITLRLNSWESVYKSILDVQQLSSIVNESKNEEIRKDDYFLGEAEKYIFFLLELDGEQRLEKLNVNRIHYRNKEKADIWRKKISKIIHPDYCNHYLATKAMAELNEMYKEMVR